MKRKKDAKERGAIYKTVRRKASGGRERKSSRTKQPKKEALRRQIRKPKAGSQAYKGFRNEPLQPRLQWATTTKQGAGVCAERNPANPGGGKRMTSSVGRQPGTHRG